MLTPDSSQETNTPPTDDWSLLRNAASNMLQWDVYKNLALNEAIVIDGPHCAEEVQEVFTVVTQLVPKLLDAYADLWELSMNMTAAWEALEASKQSLYVPDAQDMVQLKRDGEL